MYPRKSGLTCLNGVPRALGAGLVCCALIGGVVHAQAPEPSTVAPAAPAPNAAPPAAPTEAAPAPAADGTAQPQGQAAAPPAVEVHAAAMAWYRKAADQGDTSAQTALGFMYYDGQGVPQDNVVAHMWFNLAAAGGNLVAARKRDAVEEKMTLAQIAEAQRLAREWKPTFTPH